MAPSGTVDVSHDVMIALVSHFLKIGKYTSGFSQGMEFDICFISSMMDMPIIAYIATEIDMSMGSQEWILLNISIFT